MLSRGDVERKHRERDVSLCVVFLSQLEAEAGLALVALPPDTVRMFLHDFGNLLQNVCEVLIPAEDENCGFAVELTRRGEPVAVLVGRKEYDRLKSTSRTFGDAWAKFSRTVDLSQVNIDPDEIFSDVRDDTPGGDTRL